MKTRSQLAAALVSALLSISVVPAVRAQAPSDGAIRMAQNNGGYIPPSGRSSQPSGDDYDAPQRISPRRGDAPPPPPPYQGDQGDGGYDRRDAGYDRRGGGYDRREGDYEREAAAPDGPRRDRRHYDDGPPPPYSDRTYSVDEIVDAGHRFFGGISKGLAKVVEYTFSQQGRPNGYILGEEAGGAIIAGLRYGEGRLFTKSFGSSQVYWQGPSFGYDFGAEGSKTLILVYNLLDPNQIYNRFAGVDGSAYFVGGVGVTFQTYDDVVLAPIRSGVGVRLGANVGYLKYTRMPTWNPF
jgi:hypothetical protein